VVGGGLWGWGVGGRQSIYTVHILTRQASASRDRKLRATFCLCAKALRRLRLLIYDL
jgi:ribosomal protein L35